MFFYSLEKLEVSTLSWNKLRPCTSLIIWRETRNVYKFHLNSRVCILPLVCSFESALYPGLQSTVCIYTLKGRTFHFRTPDPKSEKPRSEWLCSHISNLESKHIYYSFISSHYKLNPPRKTDANPQFAWKNFSLNGSNGPHTHSPWHTTFENQLGNPASFAGDRFTRRVTKALLN